MRVNRMHLDGQLNSKPEGSTLQNKNVGIRKVPGTWTGEPGTILLSDMGKYIFGEVQLPNNTKLLFLEDDELAILNGNGTYSLKIDSNLKITSPVHGVAAYNNNNEIVVAWVDGTFPKYLNLSKIPSVITDDNISLNLFKINPTATITMTYGTGNLLSGVIYPIVQGITDEGTTTGWIIFNPIKVYDNNGNATTISGSPSGKITKQGIKVDLSNEYANYNYGYIYKRDGELFAYNLGKAGRSFTITGNENKATITLEEVLLERSFFKGANLISRIENAIYLGDLTYYEEPDIQLQVNQIGVTWKSELVDISTLNYGTQKAGYMPGEVMALYFRYEYKWGYGSWFPIPGRAKQTGDNQFLFEDTAKTDGTTGYWENADELYPDEARYGALRNQKVRHHGLPSLNWLKVNLYSGDNTVGTNRLPRLEFVLNNVPTNADAIGWQLGYAERTPQNSNVLSYTPVINSIIDSGLDPGAILNNIYSAGANILLPPGNIYGFPTTAVEGKHFRLYPFELLLGATASPKYLRREYKLTSGDFKFNVKIRRQLAALTQEEYDKLNFRFYGTIDYTTGTVETVASTEYIADTTYLPKDVFLNKVDNFMLESAYLLTMTTPTNVFPVTSPTFIPDVFVKEQTYLISLLNGNTNVYKAFDKQIIVTAGTNNNYTGDCYITDYTFHTYGKKRSNDENYQQYDAGLVFARRIATYSVHPISLRYVVPGSTPYTEYYPKLVLDEYSDSWLTNIEPNGFVNGFNRDYSSLMDIQPPRFYNSKQQYRRSNWITRSQLYQSVDNYFNWRDFRVNDVLILSSAHGRMTALNAIGDLMYIHFEHDLYITRGGEELQMVGKRVTYVGTGDIFAQQPEEVIRNRNGALGLAHRICAVVTDYGYAFVDTMQNIGAVYLVNGQDVKILSENGMIQFFRENLNALTSKRGKTIQLGYDPVFKRLLIMHKGKMPKRMDRYRGEYVDGMVLQLNDIVFKDGKFVKAVPDLQTD